VVRGQWLVVSNTYLEGGLAAAFLCFWVLGGESEW
jgi:hypothetical protein